MNGGIDQGCDPVAQNEKGARKSSTNPKTDSLRKPLTIGRTFIGVYQTHPKHSKLSLCEKGLSELKG